MRRKRMIALPVVILGVLGVGLLCIGYNQSQQEVTITSPWTVSYAVGPVVTSFVSTPEITSSSIIAKQDQLSGLGQSCLPVDVCSAPAATFGYTESIVRYAVTISAGPVQISFTSVGGPVDFWILSYSSEVWGSWFNGDSLNASLAAPSVFVKANVANFNGSVQIPATDEYYVIFANPNPQPVALKFQVNYPMGPVYQQITIYQYPNTTAIRCCVAAEAPMGFGIVFYSGLVVIAIGVALTLMSRRKRTASKRRRRNIRKGK